MAWFMQKMPHFQKGPEGPETMSQTTPDPLFAICAMDEIAPGAARAFDLAEADGEGGAKPFRIVVARTKGGKFHAYRNACPHQGVWLNIGSGTILDEAGALIRCGRHGATFAIETGYCSSGACEGAFLRKVEVDAIDGDVCIKGVALLEDEPALRHPDDMDETMEITIHPG